MLSQEILFLACIFNIFSGILHTMIPKLIRMRGTIVSDSELLQHLIAGDEAALRGLYDRYWNRLYEYAVHKLEYQETAEEIVQDVFIDLWRRRGELAIDRLEPYLFRAVRNRVIDVMKASLIRRHHEESSQLTRASDSRKLDAEEEFAYKELYLAIHEGLGLLPEKTGEIFRMNRLDQLSAREISTLLDMPLRTVEYHITHALRTMKVYLRDFLVLVVLLANG